MVSERGLFMRVLSKIVCITLFFCSILYAIDIINQTNSPKFVEIMEHRPAGEHATFGFTIFQGELQPGEVRVFNPSCPELVIDVRWDKKQVVADEKYMLREDNPERIAQWQCIGHQYVRQLFNYGRVPIMLPPNTPVSKTSNGDLSFELQPGHKVTFNPNNHFEARATLLREVPFRLLKDKIVERIINQMVLFNKRIVHKVSWRPVSQQEHTESISGPRHILIRSSDDDTVIIDFI